MALAPAAGEGAAGLGGAHRVQVAVGDVSRIGFYRALVAEGLPSLRLAAGRLIEFAHSPKTRGLGPFRFWST
jgi:hypothetical protein